MYHDSEHLWLNVNRDAARREEGIAIHVTVQYFSTRVGEFA